MSNWSIYGDDADDDLMLMLMVKANFTKNTPVQRTFDASIQINDILYNDYHDVP